MDSSSTIIDPSGDLLLIATSSTEPFAPWGDLEVQADTPSEPQELRARVSSTTLRLSSFVFQKELDPAGLWIKPQIESDGLRHKHISGFDPWALEHVLNILHFRNSRVPKSLPAEDLAKIAVIVDYLGCHDAFAFVSQSWLSEAKPAKYKFSRKLILWLFVSSVFDCHDVFHNTARTAIEYASGPFQTLGLPFQESVVKLLDQHRKDRITSLLKVLCEFRRELLNGTSCTPECNSWSLGTLMRCMEAANGPPCATEPFVGISISEIDSVLTKFRMKATDNVVYKACHRNLPGQDRFVCDKRKRLSDILDMNKTSSDSDLKLPTKD